MTQDEFISKAQIKHKGKYDYSLVEYVKGRVPVEIICNKHGVFEQKPENHLQGKGCRKCGYEGGTDKRKSTLEDFLSKARKTHGYKYEYDITSFTKSSSKIRSWCSKHGWFEQKAYAHLRGSSCRSCKCETPYNKLTKEQVVTRIKGKFQDKYEILPFDYIDNKQKLPLVCKEHGTWSVTLADLNKTKGCPACSIKTKALASRGTTESWVAKAAKVHPRYDYSLVEYVTSVKPVKIICPEHGEFETNPSNFLKQKVGCNLCSNKLNGLSYRMSLEDFIKKSNSVHGDMYDYSETLYTTVMDKVKVICKLHGEFYQNAGHHLNGHGCSKCGDKKKRILTPKKLLKNKLDYLKMPSGFYVLRLPSLGNSVYKIGISCDVETRVKVIANEINAKGSVETVLYKPLNLYESASLEQHFHAFYKELRFTSPVHFAGHTELFTLTCDDIDYIEEIISVFT